MIHMGRYEACFEETGNRRIELGKTMPLNNIWSILLLALGIYLALGLLLFLFQGRLLYYPNLPSRAIVATPERIGLAYEPVEIVTDDGIRLDGWFVPATTKLADVGLIRRQRRATHPRRSDPRLGREPLFHGQGTIGRKRRQGEGR